MEKTPVREHPRIREDVVRQLEQFPVEVLEAALLILQAQQPAPKPK